MIGDARLAARWAVPTNERLSSVGTAQARSAVWLSCVELAEDLPMKALQFTAIDRLDLVEIPVPVPGPNEVLIRTGALKSTRYHLNIESRK